MPGEINIDNESSKTSTKLTVEVRALPQHSDAFSVQIIGACHASAGITLPLCVSKM